MTAKTIILAFLSLIVSRGYSQDNSGTSLTIGDMAPQLKVRDWLKGDPVAQLAKGQVYVLEFWATWCKPCLLRMPHVSSLAQQYRDKIHFIGIDVYEPKKNSTAWLRRFVDSVGYKIDFPVAVSDSVNMVADWLNRSGENGIPVSFVVDAEGRIAFIGYPTKLDLVLPKILDSTWDVAAAAYRRTMDSCLWEKDKEAGYDVMKYSGDPYKTGDMGKPDSMLLAISNILQIDPEMKYQAGIICNNFASLLKINPHQAYVYAKELLKTLDPFDMPYHMIWSNIQYYSDKLPLPDEIYALGAETYRQRIEAYPETAVPDFYHQMAAFYHRIKEDKKASAAEQQAISLLKEKKWQVKTKLPAYRNALRTYAVSQKSEKARSSSSESRLENFKN